jgi:hypothetical protein
MKEADEDAATMIEYGSKRKRLHMSVVSREFSSSETVLLSI